MCGFDTACHTFPLNYQLSFFHSVLFLTTHPCVFSEITKHVFWFGSTRFQTNILQFFSHCCLSDKHNVFGIQHTGICIHPILCLKPVISISRRNKYGLRADCGASCYCTISQGSSLVVTMYWRINKYLNMNSKNVCIFSVLKYLFTLANLLNINENNT